MADERRALHAYLSGDAHEAWHEFAAEQGVSVSGLLEAYGLELVDVVSGKAKIRKDQTALVDSARKIDAARRRRRRAS
ncbi:MAG: hypothetical protein JJU45_08965 [Acidimicrobiia bacterium]|nr:hypothetical protein [Acidimicrobiia bacterium]